MPIVDIEKLEKEATKREAETMEIISKHVGDKIYFQGKVIDDWFDRYDDCHKANEEAAKHKEFKKLGLNELGQTPEQVAIIAAVSELKKEKSDLLKKIVELDARIGEIASGRVKLEKKVSKK